MGFNLNRVIVLFVIAALVVGLALSAPPVIRRGNDWQLNFIPVGQAVFAGNNPYAPALGFANPPWSLFIIVPMAIIPPNLAQFLPALALLMLAYARRKPTLIPLVGLSAPFVMTSLYANIDWLVMIGVALGGPVGVTLDTIKPQAGIAVLIAEWVRRETWRERVRLFLLLGALGLLTAPLWVDWLHSMTVMSAAQERSLTSLYPRWMGLAVAFPALWLTWRRKSPIWGCVASLALAPYWQFMSLLPLTYLVAERDWRWGIVFNLAGWVFLYLVIIRTIPLVF